MKAIFAGSFDPFTLGHRELVVRAINAGFEQIIVAVAEDTGKKTAPLSQRVDMAKRSILDLCQTETVGFSGLTTDFALKNGCKTILRGLRDGEDISYERNLLAEYKRLGDVEVVYIITDLNEISSTMVRQAAASGGSLKGLVSPQIERDVINIYGAKTAQNK